MESHITSIHSYWWLHCYHINSADRLPVAEHTNPVWSLVNNSADCLKDPIWNMIYLSQPSLEIKISQPVLFLILPFFIKSISSDPQLYGGKLQNIPFISHNDFLEFCIPSFVKVGKIRRCKVFHKLCSSYFLFIFILQSSSWEFRIPHFVWKHSAIYWKASFFRILKNRTFMSVCETLLCALFTVLL